MWLPQIIIGLVCLGFGIAATRFVVPKLIVPLLETPGELNYIGVWESSSVTLLIAVSLILGFVIYLLGKLKRFRTTEGFIGGETVDGKIDFSSTEFYKTVSNFKLFSAFYRIAQKRGFDIYDNSKKLVLNINSVFSKAHAGVLPLYALWVIFGMIILIIVLLF